MWRLCGAGERGLQGNGALRGASACETWMQARARALDRRSVAGTWRIVAPKAVVRPWPVGVWCALPRKIAILIAILIDV